MKTVFVFGCDGYIGNGITQRLLNKGYDVIGFDNFWRRRWIEGDMKSTSATYILDMEEKTKRFRDFYRKPEMPFHFEELDIANQSTYLDLCFADYKPDVVIDLAHNPSGPYSMISRDKANEVLTNNIIGTNNVLWSIKKHCPNCHCIFLGTAGEYDHYSNIDIEEGYIEFKHKGRKSKKMIYPRRPGSVYHTSKTASTYLIDYLTRAWKLNCTDIMQGIVFGVFTDEIDKFDIYSRFDFDEAGGTVINRFIVQSILGIPLTIYGAGEHYRSFLSLNDSIQALELLIENTDDLKEGEVRVINQLSEWHSMNSIAEMIVKAGKEMGLDVKTQHIETPREEYTGDHYYNFVTKNLKDKGYKPTRTIEEEIKYSMNVLLPFKNKLEAYKDVVIPKIKFKR